MQNCKVMRMQVFVRSLVCQVVLAVVATPLVAASIFEDSFDYGDSTVQIGTVGSWSSGSSVLKYDHDGGLDNAGLAGTSGGAMWLDYNDARSASHSFSNSLDLSTLGEGNAVWVASLFEYVTGNSSHTLSIGGGSVSEMGIAIGGSSNVVMTCTLNQTVNAGINTGINLGSGTYLILLRYTKGSGTSPNDSRVDLWINPADTSSEDALGMADWTLDSNDGQVKWGRDTDSLTGISLAQPSQQGRIDEIRIATDLATITGGVQPPPPPGTLVVIK
jgi:hypothetical protein